MIALKLDETYHRTCLCLLMNNKYVHPLIKMNFPQHSEFNIYYAQKIAFYIGQSLDIDSIGAFFCIISERFQSHFSEYALMILK